MIRPLFEEPVRILRGKGGVWLSVVATIARLRPPFHANATDEPHDISMLACKNVTNYCNGVAVFQAPRREGWALF